MGHSCSWWRILDVRLERIVGREAGNGMHGGGLAGVKLVGAGKDGGGKWR